MMEDGKLQNVLKKITLPEFQVWIITAGVNKISQRLKGKRGLKVKIKMFKTKK